MARMYPDVFPGPVDPNNPEFVVYQSLRTLSDSYVIFYSKRFKGGLFGKPECEIDFTIFNQRDVILCLEVKGGVLFYDGEQDRWLQNGKPMPKAPDRQASAATHCLIDALHDVVHSCNVDWALCFPQCTLVDTKSPTGVPLARIIDESHLSQISAHIARIEADIRRTFKRK